MRRDRWVGRGLGAAMLGVLLGMLGCEIQEITVAEPESIPIAEVYFRISDGVPDGFALLHQTTGGPGVLLRGSRVFVTGPSGLTVQMEDETVLSECLGGLPPAGFQGLCFRLTGDNSALVRAGERTEVRIVLPDGAVMHGAVRMPGNYTLLTPTSSSGECRILPGTQLPVRWTPSAGAWAYLPEATVFGLEVAFLSSGIRVPTDPLTLQGISISEADTSILFPAQFGIFNRFSGDREVLVALQQGFPSTSPIAGRVWVSALERNAVNWNRGGNFNPSGAVRIPSVFGAGTGVVAGVVNRSFVFTTRSGLGLPLCAN
jgi:hypothetical protein